VLCVRYIKGVVVAAGLILLILGGMVGCAMVAGQKQDSALTQCTHTPPDDPFAGDRTGSITVRWDLFRLRYDCVYRHPDGTVVIRPPG
jgi:hypothetical protein